MGAVSERQECPLEVESEGSRTQTLAVTNRKIILRLCGMDESAKQDEILYY